MNEEDLNKFYDAYKKYTEENKSENKNNVFDFETAQYKNKNIRSTEADESIGFKFKLSFGIKPSDSFVDKMDARLDRVQKALDDLRGELYLYPDL